jgi:hypothetical protein
MKKNGRKPRRSMKLHSHVAAGGDTRELAAQLAPLEERGGGGAAQGGASRNNGGSIVVDTGALKMPAGLAAQQEDRRILGFEPVVIFIVVLALAFIAFVAWQVSQMAPASP